LAVKINGPVLQFGYDVSEPADKRLFNILEFKRSVFQSGIEKIIFELPLFGPAKFPLKFSDTDMESQVALNEALVQKYMDGFNKLDHAQILSCLADDVEWVIQGYDEPIKGKDAFDRNIESPDFEGKPVITVNQISQIQSGVVFAEGTVLTHKKGGAAVNIAFSDLFVIKDGKIQRLTSNLQEIK
jgi:ketosteroid isomerase-like protein